MIDDIFYMKHALKLAKMGCGNVNPNPMVGAVIVKDNIIIGEGYHEKYGELHAERNALKNCNNDPKGATMYVTLEPCCHYGKTPPCTEAIIQNKIRKVVIGSHDPNPKVNGGGIEILKQHGIIVESGVLKQECDKLNSIFFHYIKTKTPYVIMKYAMTADGKIATSSGQSKWITSQAAREHVHKTRHKLSAVMVGVNTVLNDDPFLTCRLPEGKNPTRIICDSNLRTPFTSNIVKDSATVPTIIATVSQNLQLIEKFLKLGVKVVTTKEINGKVDLKDLMLKLGSMKIDSVLLEGGAKLNYSALASGIINKLHVYIAPKIFCGGISPIAGTDIDNVEEAFTFKYNNTTLLDQDILLEYEVEAD